MVLIFLPRNYCAQCRDSLTRDRMRTAPSVGESPAVSPGPLVVRGCRPRRPAAGPARRRSAPGPPRRPRPRLRPVRSLPAAAAVWYTGFLACAPPLGGAVAAAGHSDTFVPCAGAGAHLVRRAGRPVTPWPHRLTPDVRFFEMSCSLGSFSCQISC